MRAAGASLRGFEDGVLDGGAERAESCAKSEAVKERGAGRLGVIGWGEMGALLIPAARLRDGDVEEMRMDARIGL